MPKCKGFTAKIDKQGQPVQCIIDTDREDGFCFLHKDQAVPEQPQKRQVSQNNPLLRKIVGFLMALTQRTISIAKVIGQGIKPFIRRFIPYFFSFICCLSFNLFFSAFPPPSEVSMIGFTRAIDLQQQDIHGDYWRLVWDIVPVFLTISLLGFALSKCLNSGKSLTSRHVRHRFHYVIGFMVLLAAALFFPFLRATIFIYDTVVHIDFSMWAMVIYYLIVCIAGSCLLRRITHQVIASGTKVAKRVATIFIFVSFFVSLGFLSVIALSNISIKPFNKYGLGMILYLEQHSAELYTGNLNVINHSNARVSIELTETLDVVLSNHNLDYRLPWDDKTVFKQYRLKFKPDSSEKELIVEPTQSVNLAFSIFNGDIQPTESWPQGGIPIHNMYLHLDLPINGYQLDAVPLPTSVRPNKERVNSTQEPNN